MNALFNLTMKQKQIEFLLYSLSFYSFLIHICVTSLVGKTILKGQNNSYFQSVETVCGLHKLYKNLQSMKSLASYWTKSGSTWIMRSHNESYPKIQNSWISCLNLYLTQSITLCLVFITYIYLFLGRQNHTSVYLIFRVLVSHRIRNCARNIVIHGRERSCLPPHLADAPFWLAGFVLKGMFWKLQ